MSQVAASNFPAGSDSPANLDDVQRAQASFIAQLRDGKGFSSPVTLASAATTDIGGQNSAFVEISGTTGITSFGTTYNGPRFLRFTGALILTHSATLSLPGAENITTAAGDTAIAYPNSAGTGWVVTQFQRAASLTNGAAAPAAAAPGANADITSLTALTAGGLPDNSVLTADIAAAQITAPKLSGAQTGSAPIYGVRGWCRFDGTLAGTNAPTAGGNVTSVTRNGVGDYTINFTTALPSANYAISVNNERGAGNLWNVTSPTTSSCRIQSFTPHTFDNVDSAHMNFSVVG